MYTQDENFLYYKNVEASLMLGREKKHCTTNEEYSEHFIHLKHGSDFLLIDKMYLSRWNFGICLNFQIVRSSYRIHIVFKPS